MTIGRGTVGSRKVRRGMRKEIDHMAGWGVYDNVERAEASANPKRWSFDPDG